MGQAAIGTQDLYLNYASAARHFAITALNAEAILKQPYLDISKMDSGLAVKIEQYQMLMKNTSKEFQNNALTAFIKSVTEGESFSELTELFIDQQAPNIDRSLTNSKIKGALLSVILSVKQSANEISFDTKLLVDTMTLLDNSFSEFKDKFDKELDTVIDSAGDKVKELSDLIDKTRKEMAENIEGVVKGGEDIGKGIADLTVGIVTEISKIPSSDKPTGEDKDKDKEKKKAKAKDDDKPTDPSFAVEAIKLSASGVANATKAAKDFKRNLNLLTDLYQGMATQKGIVTVAKIIQSQNDLFFDSFKQSQADINNLQTDWDKVDQSFNQLKRDVQDLETPGQAEELTQAVKISKREWEALLTELKKIKTAFTQPDVLLKF